MRWFVYLARLSIKIIFGTVLMLLEALIFLMNKTKEFLTKLFYTLLEATKL